MRYKVVNYLLLVCATFVLTAEDKFRFGITVPEHLTDSVEQLARALEKLSRSNIKTEVVLDCSDKSNQALNQLSKSLSKFTLASDSNVYLHSDWEQIDLLVKKICTTLVGCILSCLSVGYLNKHISSLFERKELLHLIPSALSSGLFMLGLVIMQKNESALDYLDSFSSS